MPPSWLQTVALLEASLAWKRAEWCFRLVQFSPLITAVLATHLGGREGASQLGRQAKLHWVATGKLPPVIQSWATSELGRGTGRVW